MTHMTCHTSDGGTKEIDAARVQLRLSAHGVVINSNAEILFVHVKNTGGRLWLPGGGVEIHESLQQGLQREIMEETGWTVEVRERIDQWERYFYCEPPVNQAYRVMMNVFLCDAILQGKEPVEDDPSETATDPCWVPLNQLVPKCSPEVLLQPTLPEFFARCAGLIVEHAAKRMR
ncbi:NUDIX domain-containing protein [Candidatus Uhrbacteria bacterium]|nr:NUDIX domain-containing protein [Candidatus Uhrbacteria bacterium]MBD3284216.1 NUDIX domain-containing protein [Candidatus Uhrbacteria bacterium]